MLILCGDIKSKLRTPLGQWRLNNNKYTTSWKWFLSPDLRTLYYREHGTWDKYTELPNRSPRYIEFQTDTKSKSQGPPHSQVYIISLTSSTTTHLRIEATIMGFTPQPSGPPLD